MFKTLVTLLVVVTCIVSYLKISGPDYKIIEKDGITHYCDGNISFHYNLSGVGETARNVNKIVSQFPILLENSPKIYDKVSVCE